MHNEKEMVEAMAAAKKAFNDYLGDEYDLDAAYFDVEITGYSLSTYEFEPLTAVTMHPTHEVQSGDEDTEEK